MSRVTLAMRFELLRLRYRVRAERLRTYRMLAGIHWRNFLAAIEKHRADVAEANARQAEHRLLRQRMK